MVLIYCDMSTISPGAAREVASRGRQHHIRVLDAPVSGGEAGAVDGSLSIMVGGSAADVDLVKPVLDAMGRTVIHVGSNGAGLAVSRILERKARTMLARDFKPGFRVDLHHKDLGIVLSTARDANVVVPLA